MRLSLEEVRRVTQGAARVEEVDGQIRFFRFTAEQEALYHATNLDFWQKSFATAGVVLRFRTDSPWMRLRLTALRVLSRTYFAVDVLKDGEFVGAIQNFREPGEDPSACGDALPEAGENYQLGEYPLGEFHKEFVFDDAHGEGCAFGSVPGEGAAAGACMKTITIHLPWSVDLRLDALELQDGAVVEPVVRPKKLICFGDSITQGYDALHPMNRYTAAVAAHLDAEETNKAIGADVFFPALAAAPDPEAPDYVLVAYGTNDWGVTTWERFAANCPAFYRNLSAAYPAARIFALLPIWRKDMDEVRRCCPFRKVAECIREWTADLPNVTVIDCFDFVPHKTRYFADFRLHTNDEGFSVYGRNLCGKLPV